MIPAELYGFIILLLMILYTFRFILIVSFL